MKAVRLALVAAGAGILAAVLLVVILHVTSHKFVLVQPPRTEHPQAPGISIAKENFDLPDPFLFSDGKKYYLYLSSAFGNITSDPLGELPQHTPTLTGEPGHWSKKPFDAVPKLPDWAQPGLTWAPAVYELGHRYVMYVTFSVAGTKPLQHCIGIATARRPSGPFHARGTPFVCQKKLGGDIDPQLFVDPHGPRGPRQPNYLVWKSDNNSVPGDGTTSIWAQPLSNDGLTLEDKPVSLFQPTRKWELPLVEAPQMALSPQSTVWVFFSGGTGFFSPDYAMGAVKCKGPLGPCKDVLRGPLIASNRQGAGPGEETYFVGGDGSDWLLYSPVHAQDLKRLFRPIEAARIGWGKNGPYVGAAGSFPLATCNVLGGDTSPSCSSRADSGSR